MKKVLLAVMALAISLGAVSCKKDKEEEGNNSGETTYVDGKFNPSQHISSLMGPGIAQSWQWDNSDPKTLTRISDPVNQSNYAFTYKASGRQGVVDYSDAEHSRRYTFSYDDGLLDNIEYRQDNSLMYNGQAYYSGGKLSHMNYANLSTRFMIELANEQLGLNIPTESSIDMPNPAFTVDYTWNGANVSREKIDVQLEGTVDVQDLYDMFSDQMESAFGAYAAILPLLIQNMGDVNTNFTLTISRNETYTYDSKLNPFYGYWGDGLMFNTKVLSKNNIKGAVTSGSARFQASVRITLPEECPDFLQQYSSMWTIIRALLNNRDIPIDRTLPLDNTETFSYQYNSSNYPNKVTDKEGNAYTYQY